MGGKNYEKENNWYFCMYDADYNCFSCGWKYG